MVTAYTKQDFRKALESKERKILVKGEYAQTIRKKVKVKKAAKIGGFVLMIGSAIAIPLTGGTSVAGVAVGSAMLAGLTVTISTAELAILCGAAVAIYGITKGAKIAFNSDGSVEVEPKYE